MVSEKPFLPPSQQSSSHASTSGVAGKKKEADQTITAAQPVEAPGVTPATRPVEAPGAAGEFQPNSQSPAATLSSGRPEVQPPGPTVQPTSSATQPEEFTSDDDQLSDRLYLSLDEGELCDTHSQGPYHEELLDTDQELSAEQTYGETLRGVTLFMGWDQVPEFDSSSSAQDHNPFAGTRPPQPGKVSVKVPVDDWLCWKFEKLNITVQEGYPSWA